MDTVTLFTLFKCQVYNNNVRRIQQNQKNSNEPLSFPSTPTSRVSPSKVVLHSPDPKPINVWDDVRYLLELRFGLHRASARSQQCYFTGMLFSVFVLNQSRWDDKYRLMARDVIRSGAHPGPDNTILLWRRPLHTALARYIPTRFNTNANNDQQEGADSKQTSASALDSNGAFGSRSGVGSTMNIIEPLASTALVESVPDEKTEDAMLLEVMRTEAYRVSDESKKLIQTYKKRKVNEAVKHPSDYELNELRQPRPSPSYACNQCNMCGHHFRTDCPQYKDVYDDDGQLVKKQRSGDQLGIAHGIPRRFLKKVDDATATSCHTSTFTTAADNKNKAGAATNAKMRTSDGELVTDQRIQVRELQLTTAGATVHHSTQVHLSLTTSEVRPVTKGLLKPLERVVERPTQQPPTNVAASLLPLDAADVFSSMVHAAPLRHLSVSSFGYFQHLLEYSSNVVTTSESNNSSGVTTGFWFDIENRFSEMDDEIHKQREAFYAKHPEMREKLRSMCTHWLRGLCQKEWSCEYLHQYNVDTMPICKFFLHSKCEHGQECVFRHVLPPSTLTTNPCLDYALGFCADGTTCNQQHLKRAQPSRADFAGRKEIFELFINLFPKKSKSYTF